MAEPFRVALIGGSSHVGKSTTALALATRLGWPCASTDSMARHPGRPWSTATFALPDHVVAHYRALSPDELTDAQLAHYRNMWPLVARRVEAALADGAEPLVLEGSGVMPEPVASMGLAGVRAVWLTAPPELIEARIRRESGFDDADIEARALIAKFVRRSQLYDAEVIGQARRLGLPLVEVIADTTREAALEACLAALRA